MFKPGMKVELIQPEDLAHWNPNLEESIGRTYEVFRVMDLPQDWVEENPQLSKEKLVEVDGIFGFLLTNWLRPLVGQGQVGCPLCKWPAIINFNLVLCDNPNCQNGKGYGHDR